MSDGRLSNGATKRRYIPPNRRGQPSQQQDGGFGGGPRRTGGGGGAAGGSAWGAPPRPRFGGENEQQQQQPRRFNDGGAPPAAAAQQQQQPQRFSNLSSSGDVRRGGGGGGGGSGWGSDRSGGGGGWDSRRNRGGGGGSRFSGWSNYSRHDDRSMDRNEALEKELFGEGATTVSAGIDFAKYDDIPVETSGNDIPPGITAFDDVELNPQLLDNIRLAGFSTPTPVQKHSLPIGTARRDLMACAQTGSGKTAGFLLPCIQAMLAAGGALEVNNRNHRGGRSKCYPQCLILSPTRELATQIHTHARKFLYRTGMRAVVVYGGAPIRDQLRELDYGADILVATPGRLVDMVDRGRVSLEMVSWLVFDEADRMLDMGFEPQIRMLVEQSDMPLEERQTLMFSATFPREIQILAQDFLKDYVFLAVGRVGSTVDAITQRVEFADFREKNLC